MKLNKFKFDPVHAFLIVLSIIMLTLWLSSMSQVEHWKMVAIGSMDIAEQQLDTNERLLGMVDHLNEVAFGIEKGDQA